MTESRSRNDSPDALVNDLKLWAASPRVPEKVQLLILEAIGRLTRSESGEHEGYPGIAHDLETMRTALQRIAITDDADCSHATDPEAMKKIARDALRGVK